MINSPRRFRDLRRTTSIVFFWILIVILTAVLIWILNPLPKLVISLIFFILALRIAGLVPGFGRFWRWIFGERSFWEWMVLLAGPIILAILGNYISHSFSASQEKVAIISNRLSITKGYFDAFESLIRSRNLRDPQGGGMLLRLESYVPTPNNDCSPIRDRPDISLAYVRTISTLSSLTDLRLKTEEFNPLKRGIVQFLYYSGYISRGSTIVSLHKADLRHANLSHIELRNTCFDNSFLRFSSLAGADLSRSSFKNAILADSDISGANLAEANLERSDLSGSVLNEISAPQAIVHNVILLGSQLRNANLDGSDLRCSNFEKTDLRGASLKNSDLRGASFMDADLRGADLSNSTIGSWSCSENQLRETSFSKSIINNRPISNSGQVSLIRNIHSLLKPIDFLIRVDELVPEPVEINEQATILPLSVNPGTGFLVRNHSAEILNNRPEKDLQ